MQVIKSYVPILRTKQAEKDALANIPASIRDGITPLFELIMPAPKRDKDHPETILADSKTVLSERMKKFGDDIRKCCIDGSALIDVHLIDGDVRAQTLKQALDAAEGIQTSLIPVTHIIPVISTSADMATRQVAINYALSSDNGVCIRIDRISLDDEDLADNILSFVRNGNLETNHVDLLIDLGIVTPVDEASIIAGQLAKLPALNNWRSFILAGGAFPKDLSEIDKHSQEQIPRYDWQLWEALQSHPSLTRLPIFSDYTIQHPIHYGYVEGVVNTSASIRYTDKDVWEISRGEGLRNKKGAGYLQYPALAKILTGQSFYKGSDYSYGDTYISDRAKVDNKNSGNPMTWLKAAINHHITLVVKESAKLRDRSKSV